ncbi:MAG: DUF1491 family protein [Rhodospirillales bacterium]|nr:DUF1491 family protein [Rhodospirillales bacterium]MBO6785751.1 DUF1491 family protein [Rhodospirillales bacterium]
MEEPRVKASVWISAQIRMCGLMTLPAVVRRRGDADAGSILIKLDRLDGHSVLLSQSRDAQGKPAWLQWSGEVPLPDADVESYIERRIRDDPDIWVLEIEDRNGEYEPDAPVIL